jgi:hypothetical protein
MNWAPISLDELETLLARDLLECPSELIDFFETVRILPAKWSQKPYGVEGGGFWVVATKQDIVLWYNDIEDGFNVSRFVTPGQIPDNEYWCNHDSLRVALIRLAEKALNARDV